MLYLNDTLTQKVAGDVEQPLPFKAEEFDSATAIFLLNYISNLSLSVSEIKRILKPHGKCIVVLSKNPVNKIHQQQEKQNLTKSAWKIQLQKHFHVTLEEKNGLFFFICTK